MQSEENLMNDNLYVTNNSQFTAYCSQLCDCGSKPAMTEVRKRAAFTLAEVLITLGIIGVVAVLTLPNLMSDYRKKTYVAQLQRVYNQIQNAAQNCMADENVDNLNDTYLKYNSPDTTDMDEDEAAEAENDAFAASAGRFLKKYFRVTKNCGFKNKADCLVASYKDIYGYDSAAPSGYCVNVNTGSTICMHPFGWGNLSLSTAGYFIVDVNGKSGPNVYQRDVFRFELNYRGDISEQFKNDGSGEIVSNAQWCLHDSGDAAADPPFGLSYIGCFDKIIEDGWKMNY